MEPSFSRRAFLKATGAGALAGGLALAPGSGIAAEPAARQSAGDAAEPMIWAYLAHLGYNMWGDRPIPNRKYWPATTKLRCETPFWRELMQIAAKSGVNMMIVDLGEGVRYESHPELAIEGSWSPAMLREELARIRDLGMEPIPKMNFSTGHDIWLGPYARQVSTPAYYKVCADLIAEVCDLFDKPRLFHLGMDEENIANQVEYTYAVIRQHDLWWEDFMKLVGWVEQAGARAWIWSDYSWDNPELFYERMPKKVMQSNWHYWAMDETRESVKAYAELEKHGYDQVPTASNWNNPENFELTVKWCRERVAPERLKGFMQTVWHPTMEETREKHVAALSQVAAGRKIWEQS